MECIENCSDREPEDLIFTIPKAWFKYIMPKQDFERLFPGFSEEIPEAELADLLPILSKLKTEYNERRASQ